MTTQALNFLWLGLDLPAAPDPEDGSIHVPMPINYIDGVRKAAKKHPNANIFLWVDSRRLTEKQMAYLKNVIEESRPNARVRNLRDIPEDRKSTR